MLKEELVKLLKECADANLKEGKSSDEAIEGIAKAIADAIGKAKITIPKGAIKVSSAVSAEAPVAEAELATAQTFENTSDIVLENAIS